jgi:LPS-assembly lipoprotein
MWSSDPILPGRRAAVLGALALAACGFTPAYGPGGGAAALRGRIALASPDDRPAFELTARLEDRLGAAEAPLYRLDYAITILTTEVAITPDGAVTRYNLTGRVGWNLVETGGGATRLSGNAESFTSYSATGSTVAGLAAEEDAEARLMVILADQIVTRLIAAAPQLTP